MVTVNRLPLIIVGLVGLVVGGVVGAAAIGGDTKTETDTTVATQVQTKTKTVRRGGGASARGPVKTVTQTKTVTAPQPYRAPGEAGPSGPTTTVEGARTFTGKDTKNFGTLKVKKRSTLEWTNTGQVFSVISQTQLHVSSQKKKGSVRLFEGTYYNFRVAAVGRWKVTITPRS
jgi:hypothetical protein